MMGINIVYLYLCSCICVFAVESEGNLESKMMIGMNAVSRSAELKIAHWEVILSRASIGIENGN